MDWCHMAPGHLLSKYCQLYHDFNVSGTKRVKRVKEIAVHTQYSMSQWTTTAWCQQCIDIYGKSLAVNILTHWALARDYEINIMSIDCCLVLITQGRIWNGALNYRWKRYKLFKVLPVSIIHQNRVVSKKIHHLWWQYIHGCQLTDLSEFDLKFQNPVMVPLINRRSDFKLEIVDQWSTMIPPPHRRGWQWVDCNWTLFKITRQPSQSDVADNR